MFQKLKLEEMNRDIIRTITSFGMSWKRLSVQNAEDDIPSLRGKYSVN